MDAKGLEAFIIYIERRNHLIAFIVRNLIANLNNAQKITVFTKVASFYWLSHAYFWHLGSLTAANWVSFDFNVSYSSCWGYSLINTLKLKEISRIISKGWEENSNAVDYIPAYHVRKEM